MYFAIQAAMGHGDAEFYAALTDDDDYGKLVADRIRSLRDSK